MMDSDAKADSDSKTNENVRFYGSLGREGLNERIRALDDEWDVEKALGVTLAGAGLFGMVMGLFGSRLWRLLTWTSLPLLFLRGRDRGIPLEAFVKRLGLRSRKEIQDEKNALKALRGDFRDVETIVGEETESLARKSARAMEAVRI